MLNYLYKKIRKIVSYFNINLNFFSDDLAKPIVKDIEKFLDKSNYNLFSFGNLNKNKIFYIIRRSPGAGMFSNVIYVLNHLLIAQKHGFIPFVDMLNFKTIYNEKKRINGTFNAWEYYFKQLSKYNIKEIYKSKKVIISENKFYKHFSHNISNKESEIFKAGKKSIFINNKIIFEAQKFIKKNFKGKVLGIHYRGTSYKISANHPFPPTKNQMLKYCKKILKTEKFSKIFLCTEDKNMFNHLKKNLGNKLCYFENSYRSYRDDAFRKYPRKNHRYNLGKEILIETIILSKCNSFICQESNVSEFLKYLNKDNKIKFYYFKNGFNSSNEYIARWLWYYKNFAPKTLGGFE